ncbi:MAG: alpha-glucan family phosphorylase [Bacteroidetes bacterium HGW-Bacteroidetes-1]|jgi:phosphorylase/glycogen(starch) synthase|nr:MAG: alpha-glucan family phosphorylase [Bacteroidetes bacterium HGW-Bacteroidetes-1]
MKKPEYIFEISWEVCNMVGGIYTVLSSKARITKEEYGDNYITIGPDVWKETHKNPYFIEDPNLFTEWRHQAALKGIKFRVGRWAIKSRPIAILIDFTPLFAQKDTIFAKFWETFQLDSINGPWDYIEPAMFGYAAGQVIESFYDNFLTGYDQIVAHFHEWMTGTGVLYLKKEVPQIATVFTTHATYLGRSIASNGLPLHRDLNQFNPSVMANRFNITAQQSLEQTAAREADAFTTVSNITSNECSQFLGRNPDVITINGFDENIAGNQEKLAIKRNNSRKKILHVASVMTGTELPESTLLVISSGRYEFKNKGIDLFIDALGELNKSSKNKRDILAVIAVPSNSSGPNKELKECLSDPKCKTLITTSFTTHFLPEASNDAVLNRIKQAGLTNSPESKVKILFVPVYLKGNDEIFDIKYYDFLAAFDLSVFPSYYEPWGYTPLESINFGIPTITTSLAGFGIWVKELDMEGKSVSVIERNEDNSEDVVRQLKNKMELFAKLNAIELKAFGKQAIDIASKALWVDLINNYKHAWDIALRTLSLRSEVFKSKRYTETLRTFNLIKQDQPTWKKVLFQPVYSKNLTKLSELSKNLWWSWNDDAIALFESIDPTGWQEYEQNPISFLESLSSKQMDAFENDPVFIGRIEKVYNHFVDYMKGVSKSDDKIAYFSMEYGLHKSLKIYSGGLGVLAGDYLKEASDSAVNLTGIGLLYRYGYFQQDISLFGDQVSQYIPQKFTHLPLEPVRDSDGNWITISIAMPGRTVIAKAWKVPVGRIPLYLLDTDIEENQMDDRTITHQLYGGDIEMRFKQEMVLGIGGIRLLEKLRIEPAIYHSNEGHSAFIGLERLRVHIEGNQISFDVAKEIVKASNLFTTHTPVPAGHDSFEEHLLRTYMPHYAERLNISWDEFVNLGKFKPNEPSEKFSMSVLATNLSQEVNGVSQIHGRVSREMFQPLYPGYFANELHIGFVTNGVHYPTWTDSAMKELYHKHFPKKFEQDQSNAENWKIIQEVKSEDIWGIRQQLKKELIAYLQYRIKKDLTNRQDSPKLILKTIAALNSNALIIGFARRFATYKRAHLLFTNLDRLSKIVNNPDKQVLFVFAGKAHPNDKAGQDLIKRIIEISKMPDFIGKVIFVENYDMELGKRLTSSTDIWLNTPTRPLEASGTSGEKAVMNGVLNFSVLDGWWAEGYKPNAGWAIEERRTYANQQFQDELDAETIYSLLENEIVPSYFDRDENGVSEKWVKFIKNNIAEIAPHFTMKRMLEDYFDRFYNKLLDRTRKMNQNHFELAHSLASWKQKIKLAWDSIEVKSIKVPDPTIRPLDFGENFVAEITLLTPGIEPGEISIELLFGKKLFDKIDEIVFIEKMNIVGSGDGWVQYHINVPVYRAGVYDYTFRIFPNHSELPHRQDFPLVKWI